MAVKILNFGSLNIDHVYHVDSFVNPGETKLSHNLQTFGGGKGNNQSIALAKAGAKVYHAGNVGADGAFLINNLQKEGVDTSFIKIDPKVPTGHAIIQVNFSGENCILLYGGANQSLTNEYIEQVLDNFQKNDILLIQNEVSNLDKIIELAGKKQMVIYFNPAPMNHGVLNYSLQLIDTFVVNQTEAAALTGTNNPQAILKKMAELFPASKTILTLGSDGVIYQDNEQQIKQPGFKTNAVDTTAAGDTFLGYFIASRQKDMSIKEALELACYAAAITVTRHGAASSIPYLNEVHEQLSNNSIIKN